MMNGSERKSKLTQEFLQLQIEAIRNDIREANSPREKLAIFLLIAKVIGMDVLTALGLVYEPSDASGLGKEEN